jgi:hypothetical protein
MQRSYIKAISRRDYIRSARNLETLAGFELPDSSARIMLGGWVSRGAAGKEGESTIMGNTGGFPRKFVGFSTTVDDSTLGLEALDPSG